MARNQPTTLVLDPEAEHTGSKFAQLLQKLSSEGLSPSLLSDRLIALFQARSLLSRQNTPLTPNAMLHLHSTRSLLLLDRLHRYSIFLPLPNPSNPPCRTGSWQRSLVNREIFHDKKNSIVPLHRAAQAKALPAATCVLGSTDNMDSYLCLCRSLYVEHARIRCLLSPFMAGGIRRLPQGSHMKKG